MALLQNEGRYEAFDIKTIFFDTHANKSHFHSKGFGTVKCPIYFPN